MKTLLLFDIDGTLILNSNAGITAYLAAVKQHHKLHIRPDELSRSCGKTDFMIIRELLDYRQMQHASERDPELLQVYLEELKKALAADPGVLAPGIPELLAKLQAEEDFVLAPRHRQHSRRCIFEARLPRPGPFLPNGRLCGRRQHSH